MNRRSFFGMLGAAVAAWPLSRIWPAADPVQAFPSPRERELMSGAHARNSYSDAVLLCPSCRSERAHHKTMLRSQIVFDPDCPGCQQKAAYRNGYELGVKMRGMYTG